MEDAAACGFQPMTLMNLASICVLVRSAEASVMIPSLVLVSRSRGIDKLKLGDDFFCSISIFQSSIQNSMFCSATNVKLVARNWLTESRFGRGVVVLL